MGAAKSTMNQSTSIELEKSDNDESVVSSPISTPKVTNLDPRSPSTNISRTPLQLNLTTTPNIIPPTSEIIENKLLLLDPRSPTTEYDRTPIIVGVTKKIRNKHLDKANNVSERSNLVAPKLLESSPISVNPNAYKRKSFVGLLETNIDFTETNLDDVNKSDLNLSRSLPENCLNSSASVEEKINNSYSYKPSPIVNIDDLGNEEMDNVDLNLNLNEQIVEETNLALTELIVGEEIEIAVQSNTKQIINITANVRSLDKKLSNLIYEDENGHLDVYPKNIKSKDSRTPLGVRNSNNNPRRSNNKLKVSDKPRKLDYAVSKIPVFNKNGRKISVHCENTPPNNKDDNVKSKKSHWDGDTTLVI